MTIEFGAIPGVLTSPTQTFERLRKGANLADGMKLFLIVIVIAGIIGLIVNLVTMPMLARLPTYSSMGNVLVTSLLGFVLGIVMNIVLFLAFCWLTNKFTSAIADKKSDLERSVGLLSYTAAAFYIIELPISILFNVGVAMAAASLDIMMMGVLGIMYLAVMLSILIWAWLIAGRAAATATGSTWGAGIAGVLLAALVIFACIVVIAIVAAVLMIASMSAMRGF